MSLNALKELIIQGEGPTLEFKRSTAELREALQVACAFLNGSGGKVVIGVKPDGVIVGQQVSDKALREIAQHMQDSVPRNPIIADVFHRAGLIERWGRGTNRVIEQCRAAGIAPPTFREVGPSTVVTFRVPVRPAGIPPVPDKYSTSTGQAADKLKLLAFCVQAKTVRQIMKHMGLSHRETFLGNYLHPLLEEGLLLSVA